MLTSFNFITIHKLLNFIIEQLSMFSDNELEAKKIICYIFNYSNTNLILNLNKIIEIKEINLIYYIIKNKVLSKPISYILGYKDFWKNRFFVNRKVLIPRLETEFLINLLIQKLSKKKIYKFLDLGTGCGSIILSIAKEFPYSKFIGIDISESALKIATLNAKILGLSQKVVFIKSNWFDKIIKGNTFDVIITNPPYVSFYDYIRLNNFIKNYEPRNSLTDEKDGLQNYRIIVNQANKFLNFGGMLLFEIGYNQEFTIKQLLNSINTQYFRDIKNVLRAAIVIK